VGSRLGLPAAAVSYKIRRLRLSNARFRSSRLRYTEILHTVYDTDGSVHFWGTVQSGGVNDRICRRHVCWVRLPVKWNLTLPPPGRKWRPEKAGRRWLKDRWGERQAMMSRCVCSGEVIAANARCCGNRWPMNSTSVCCVKSGPIAATGDETLCCEDRFGRNRMPYNSQQVGLF